MQAKNGKSETIVIDYFYEKLITVCEELDASGLLKKNQKIELWLLVNCPSAYLLKKKMNAFAIRIFRKIKKTFNRT